MPFQVSVRGFVRVQDQGWQETNKTFEVSNPLDGLRKHLEEFSRHWEVFPGSDFVNACLVDVQLCIRVQREPNNAPMPLYESRLLDDPPDDDSALSPKRKRRRDRGV
jgi:hypothetical protein